MRVPHFYYAHLSLYNIRCLMYYNRCKEVIPKEETTITKFLKGKSVEGSICKIYDKVMKL